MSYQDTIDKFVEEQKALNTPQEKIEEVLYFATNSAVKNTMDEISSFDADGSIKKLLEESFVPEKLMDESFLQDKKALVVNSQGENLEEVLGRNLASFLEEVSKEYSSQR